MSPYANLPSIGTPLHQPDEDQTIVGNPYASHMTPTNHSMNVYAPSLEMNSNMMTPSKMPHNYAPSFAPQSMMQPQTPVSGALLEDQIIYLIFYLFGFSKV